MDLAIRKRLGLDIPIRRLAQTGFLSRLTLSFDPPPAVFRIRNGGGFFTTGLIGRCPRGTPADICADILSEDFQP